MENRTIVCDGGKERARAVGRGGAANKNVIHGGEWRGFFLSVRERDRTQYSMFQSAYEMRSYSCIVMDIRNKNQSK